MTAAWERPFFMPPSRVISTLCPKRLRPSDCIDLSGLLKPRMTLPCGSTRLRGLKHNKVPFPPNTRGFLYYHTPPKAPSFVGELRFRCANSLEDFPNGKDLLSTDKFNPWSISLYALANEAAYPLRGQLMLDDLVSQTTLDTLVTANALYKKFRLGPKCPIIYYFRQPFLFHFDSTQLAFYTATKDRIGFCMANSPIKDHRSRGPRVYPYGGSGVVQLEPRRSKIEKVALRVLKIVEPVKDLIEDYDGYVQRPTEGALIQRSYYFPAAELRTSLKDAAVLPYNFEDLP
ncbi:hypothetical protein F5887DRAFT_30134 [Amanita rubescens]|nr:hypothetical protein F5887DRAFT_30134 [Amanita rubescens]